MILQSLTDYYDRMSGAPDSDLPPEGYSREKIHFALVISGNGDLVQVLDLREAQGKRMIPRMLSVPQGPKKSVNIAASFLWGNTGYVLGADDKGKPDRTLACHSAFKELHSELLSASDDLGAKSLLRFLSKWAPGSASGLSEWDDMIKVNLVFVLDGEEGFIHERPAITRIWQEAFAGQTSESHGICLITGQVAPIARLHPAIKGVRGTQSTGAALVSFNLDAFTSYGKEQNFNAPISETCAAAYAKALNYLLSSQRNRILIGDTTTIFWTERKSPVESFFGMVLDPRDTSADNQKLMVYLQSIKGGKLPTDIDGDINFYILGMAPNAARISVRFWHVSTVEEISERLGQHFRDLEIIRSFDNEPAYPGMWRLLHETVRKKSKDEPPPLLAGAVMRAIVQGTLYPQSLLSLIIGRIRADQEINYMRSAIIKAVLTRKQRLTNRGIEVSMALDKEKTDVAYLLGRLFAVLEQAQRDALGKTNATIKDRYYGSASASPRTVFPQLLRLTQHHIQKAEYRRNRDKQIEEIVGEISEFPPHLNLDQQGLFAIGYYHQRQDLSTKKKKEDVKA